MEGELSVPKSSNIMGKLNGLAWNCGGLRVSAPLSRKKALYFEKNHSNNFDIAFFLETHHKKEDEIPPAPSNNYNRGRESFWGC